MIKKNDKLKIMQFMKFKVLNVISVFIVAIALFFFLVISFNSESYAIVEDVNNFVDSFNISNSDYEITSNSVNYNGTNLDGFKVLKYSNDLGEQVFSLAHNNQDFVGTYQKTEFISDNGLLYIMGNNYPNKNIKDSKGKLLNKDLQTWITQVSVWLYLYYAELEDNGIVSSDSVNYISDDELYVIANSNEIVTGDNKIISLYDDTIYDLYIKDLVSNALKIRKNYNKSLQINTENNYVFMTNDQEYYQTSLITVTGSPSDDFNSFELNLKEVPDGSIVVDEEGKKIDNLSILSVTSKFYVRVPKKNVNNENKKLIITAIGSFENYEGYYYKSGEGQIFTNVKLANSTLEKDLVIDLNY